jgi:hypothetical protein
MIPTPLNQYTKQVVSQLSMIDFEEILHYQKIIVALSETDRLMKETDTVDFV